MVDRLQAIQELAKRGKLPADFKPYYDEAVKRGLVAAPDPKQAMFDRVAEKARGLRADQAPYVEGAIKGLEAGGGLSPEEEASGDWERGTILPIAKNTATGERKAVVPAMVMGAYDAFKLPGDVASGEVDPMSEEGIGRGVGFTTIFTPGAPRVAKPPMPGNTLKIAPKAARPDGIPTAADLKTIAQKAYDQAKGSEMAAVVNGPSISDTLTGVLSAEGLIRPDGKIAGTFGAVRTAMKDVAAFKGKPMTFEQFQRLEEGLQTVAASKNAGESRIGVLLLKALDDYFEKLPDAAFTETKAGAAATKAGYFGGKQGWAQYSKLKKIEKAISNAELAKGGFAEGLRSEFRTILKNDRKSLGFSDEELATMRKFVQGGKLDAVTGWLTGLRGAVLGSAGGGLAGAVAVPAVGAIAGALGRGGAKKTANQLRASIAAGNSLKGPSKSSSGNTLTGLGKLATAGASRASGPYADDVAERGGLLRAVLPYLRADIAAQ